MQYESVFANDGCELAYQTSRSLEGPEPAVEPGAPCILLMHGFSGSSEYFVRNFDALTSQHWVVAPDMRGHGRSGRTAGGYHVARLAVDLHNLIAHLRHAARADDIRFVPVGCSIGAAVLWTYVELFGDSDFAGFVFVDQAPLQDRSPFFSWGETKAHTGCYDERTMLGAQRAWIEDPAGAAAGLVAECLGYRAQPAEQDGVSAEQSRQDEEFFASISAQCDGRWLAHLIADHTRYDHREAIEQITVPTLVMAAMRSGCFLIEGMEETAKRVKNAEASVEVFQSGHWLFYEEAEKFNQRLLQFVDHVTAQD
ncbi:hypothetical protein OQA88_629 [Cercophora sp. LCS_1]